MSLSQPRASLTTQMSGPLQIAKNFALPIDVVTDTIAFLARRNAGKALALVRASETLFP